MDTIKNEAYKRLFAAVSEITKDTKIGIFHDVDPDGISSAAILDRAIFRIRGKRADELLIQDRGAVTITQQIIDKVKAKKIETLFILDRAIDQDPAMAKECERHCKLIVIDHHQYKNNIQSARCTFIKADMFSDIPMSAYPTARMVYDLFYTKANIKDCDWLMAIGVIGDAGYKQWKDSVDAAFDEYQITKKNDIYETKMAKCAKYITSTMIVCPGEVKSLVDALYKAKNPHEFLRSRFSKNEKAFDAEITRWMGLSEKKAEIYPDKKLVVHYITPKYGVRSVLSTLMSMKRYNGHTVVIAEEMPREKMIGLSIRNQTGSVDCIALVQKCTQGLRDASGGGHKPAVGGRVRKSDWEEFHKRILKEFGVSADAYERERKRIG